MVSNGLKWKNKYHIYGGRKEEAVGDLCDEQ
jgi:hypothetical protein